MVPKIVEMLIVNINNLTTVGSVLTDRQNATTPSREAPLAFNIRKRERKSGAEINYGPNVERQ